MTREYLDEVLDRHRQIWTERLYWVAALAGGTGLIVGYLVRWWGG